MLFALPILIENCTEVRILMSKPDSVISPALWGQFLANNVNGNLPKSHALLSLAWLCRTKLVQNHIRVRHCKRRTFIYLLVLYFCFAV